MGCSRMFALSSVQCRTAGAVRAQMFTNFIQNNINSKTNSVSEKKGWVAVGTCLSLPFLSILNHLSCCFPVSLFLFFSLSFFLCGMALERSSCTHVGLLGPSTELSIQLSLRWQVTKKLVKLALTLQARRVGAVGTSTCAVACASAGVPQPLLAVKNQIRLWTAGSP